MDLIVQTAAAAVLLAIAAWFGTLTLNAVRARRTLRRVAAADLDRLKARALRHVEKRQFVQAREELTWQGFRKFSVVRKVREADGIVSFYLAPHDRKPLPPFRPGQHLTFRLSMPGRPTPLIRCYSLSDRHRPEHFRVTVKRVPSPPDKPQLPPGAGSGYFHEQVSEGDILDVRAPTGSFTLDLADSRPVVLIGGGIGVTPVLAMLNGIVESGSRREAWFFYGVRNSDEHVMAQHLAQVAQENANVRVAVCYSHPKPEDKPSDLVAVGQFVSLDLLRARLPSNAYDFYVCGPPPMMAALYEGLREWGVPDERIHYEAFGPATVKQVAGTDQAQDAAPTAAAASVSFARSGRTVPWTAADGSLLELAERIGVRIEAGCRAGSCGTCLTAVKEGKVTYLTPPGLVPEAGSCLACIGRPASDLTLDA